MATKADNTETEARIDRYDQTLRALVRRGLTFGTSINCSNPNFVHEPGCRSMGVDTRTIDHPAKIPLRPRECRTCRASRPRLSVGQVRDMTDPDTDDDGPEVTYIARCLDCAEDTETDLYRSQNADQVADSAEKHNTVTGHETYVAIAVGGGYDR